MSWSLRARGPASLPGYYPFTPLHDTSPDGVMSLPVLHDLRAHFAERLGRRVDAPPRAYVHPPEVLIDALTALLGGWQGGFDIHIDVAPKPPRVRLVWLIGPVTEVTHRPASSASPAALPAHTPQGDLTMQLLDSQQVVLSVAAEDKAGNTVPVPGTLLWSVSDEAIATLTDNGDGTQTLVTTGTLGSIVVTASDDLDGDGAGDFLGSLAVDVVAGPVTEIIVSAGDPTDRP